MIGFLAFAFLSCVAGQIPLEYATDVTIYHVNPLSDGVIPLNMDSADALGDIYFDFRSKVLPIECAPNQTDRGNDCNNQEVVAHDLVISKLELTVDSRFGKYGLCNICMNHSAEGVKNCTNGDYVCSCGWGRSCNQTVGKISVQTHENTKCWKGQPEWECWRTNVVNKIGGIWYSTPAAGYCGDGSKPAPKGCTWSVKNVTKIVNKTCSDNVMYNYVETYDEKATKCFSACNDSGTGPSRNSSSICWTECFFKTILGPDGGVKGGAITGIPTEKILSVWEEAFESSKKPEGGCPALPPPSVGYCGKVSTDGQGVASTNQLCTIDSDCRDLHHCNINLVASLNQAALDLVV